MYLTCFCPIPESTIDRWASPHDRYNGYGWELGSEMVGREKKKEKKKQKSWAVLHSIHGGGRGRFFVISGAQSSTIGPIVGRIHCACGGLR